MTKPLGILACLFLFTSGCSYFHKLPPVQSDILTGDLQPAPVASRVTPALECLGEILTQDPPGRPFEVYVFPYAGSKGLDPDAAWQKTLDALLHASGDGNFIRVYDARPEYGGRGAVTPFFSTNGPFVLTGRAALESQIIAKYADFGAGWKTAGFNAIGLSMNSEVDRMEVSTYLRTRDRQVSRWSATSAAIFQSTAGRDVDATIALVDDVGIGVGAGILKTSSREQVLRHLIEINVFTIVTRFFGTGTSCLAASEKWQDYRDEFARLDKEGRTRIKNMLTTRLGRDGGFHVVSAVSTYDRSLSFDEYIGARASGVLKAVDVNGILSPNENPGVAASPGVLRGGLYVMNDHVLSTRDGYAECFAVDRGAGARLERLTVIGSVDAGRILRNHPYEISSPSESDLRRIVCYRGPTPIEPNLPMALRRRRPIDFAFTDLDRALRQRVWQLTSSEPSTSENAPAEHPPIGPEHAAVHEKNPKTISRPSDP